MKTISNFLGTATICALVSLASAQQPLKFSVGDAVDYKTSGAWQSCTVASPLAANGYTLRCGSSEVRATDLTSLRMHVVPVDQLHETPSVTELISRNPQGESVGARYGTREPRTCDRRKSDISATDVKDIFICDSEHEFGGTLYLVSDVSLVVTSPRPFNPNQDANKKDIDPNQPVVDLSASYNNYQCSQIPSAIMDFPGNHNCNEAKLSNTSGACYKNKAGEWHCVTYDFHPMAAATASNVPPPTIVE